MGRVLRFPVVQAVELCSEAETDGDLHIALQDETGNKPGLACNSLMNELHQCLVFERFCKEAESSRIECGLAHYWTQLLRWAGPDSLMRTLKRDTVRTSLPLISSEKLRCATS
jgi:hypothetical protein